MENIVNKMVNENDTYGLRNFRENLRDEGLFRALGKDLKETFRLYSPDTYEPKTLRKKIGGVTLCFAGVGLLGSLIVGPIIANHYGNLARKEAQENILWEVYKGNNLGYEVVIDETETRNGSRDRLVHLDALDPSTRPQKITGHDYGIDGHFERVFIMNERFDPADSVEFTDKGLLWNPSKYSKDQGKKPFSQKEIIRAQEILYSALANTRTEENRRVHWTPEDDYKINLRK